MIVHSHKETVRDQLSTYETNHSNNCISSHGRDEMVNFKPGEYMRKMIFQSVPQAARKKKIQVHLVRVELMTFELLVEMCH